MPTYIRTYFSILITLFSLSSTAQMKNYTQSGNINFSIKLSGKYPSIKNIDVWGTGNALLETKQLKTIAKNDSLISVSVFTFGPTYIGIKVIDKYFFTYMLPNQADVLDIVFTDTANYILNYKGQFKYIFELSQHYANVFLKTIDYSNSYNVRHLNSIFYKSANQYKDLRLKKLDSVIANIDRLTDNRQLKQFASLNLELFYKAMLFENPELEIERHNYKIDSVQSRSTAVKRDMSYYTNVLGKKYLDTAMLFSSNYFTFVNALLKDSLLKLPPIVAVTPQVYFSRLSNAFGHAFKSKSNLFYDMAIAIAYMNQINSGKLLTEKQKVEISSYFTNKHISKFIFNENIEKERRYQRKVGKYYLPFPNGEKEVFAKILEKYRGKVVLVDFWATWCGPCIAGFDEFKGVKEYYKDNKEVAFVYITNQSSNFAQWTDYVAKFGGEHYYLYTKQSDKIYEIYDFDVIPTYLVFDKQGNLSHKSVGLKGNEKYKAKEWLERAMNKQ